MQKWEYCVGRTVKNHSEFHVHVGTPEGVEVRKFKNLPIGNYWWVQALAKLGAEGWELVAYREFVYHFKRPLQEES
jgi:hypothetical protein